MVFMDTFYTRKQAALYLGVNLPQVKYYIEKNLLPAFKSDKIWLFRESDLKAFKESDWFQNKNKVKSRGSKYSADMPRLHLFYQPKQKN